MLLTRPATRRAVELVLAAEEHVQRLWLAMLAEEAAPGLSEVCAGVGAACFRRSAHRCMLHCGRWQQHPAPLLCFLPPQADVINGLALLALLCNSAYGEQNSS